MWVYCGSPKVAVSNGKIKHCTQTARMASSRCRVLVTLLAEFRSHSYGKLARFPPYM